MRLNSTESNDALGTPWARSKPLQRLTGRPLSIMRAMLKYLRYALATFCCAASVGCLALWIGTAKIPDLLLHAAYHRPASVTSFDVANGRLAIGHWTLDAGSSAAPGWHFSAKRYPRVKRVDHRVIGTTRTGVFTSLLPLSIVFALYGI